MVDDPDGAVRALLSQPSGRPRGKTNSALASVMELCSSASTLPRRAGGNDIRSVASPQLSVAITLPWWLPNPTITTSSSPEPLEDTAPRLVASDVANFIDLRHAVAAEPATVDAPREVPEDFLIAMDEMTSNAVRHGQPPVDRPAMDLPRQGGLHHH